MNYHSRLPLLSGYAVTNSNPNSGRIIVEYPEDIRMYGVSFNTTLGETGIALQGELSYRDNMPLQFDDVELLFSALTPLNPLIPAPGNRFISQLGDVGPGEYVRGWERHEVSQLQFTLTKAFGPGNWLGAQQIATVAEFGATNVWDLPTPDVLRYQGDGTDTGCGGDLLPAARCATRCRSATVSRPASRGATASPRAPTTTTCSVRRSTCRRASRSTMT
jgi:hypothetical protein